MYLKGNTNDICSWLDMGKRGVEDYPQFWGMSNNNDITSEGGAGLGINQNLVVDVMLEIFFLHRQGDVEETVFFLAGRIPSFFRFKKLSLALCFLAYKRLCKPGEMRGGIGWLAWLPTFSTHM